MTPVGAFVGVLTICCLGISIPWELVRTVVKESLRVISKSVEAEEGDHRTRGDSARHWHGPEFFETVSSEVEKGSGARNTRQDLSGTRRIIWTARQSADSDTVVEREVEPD